MEIAKNTIEISGSDVEEAVEKGLVELGLPRDEVEIEVLDEGSPGFLGIGGRDAKVKLTSKLERKPGSSIPLKEEGIAIEDDVYLGPEEKSEPVKAPMREVDEDFVGEEEIALEVVEQLLKKMEISAKADLKETEPDDRTGETRWVVEIEGDDLGILIGSRGDTLNAFQYVARLMTGHVTHQRPNFLIDVEGYRKKREQALTRLAERMAGKVLKRGRPVTLEPMPPNERRIIHIALRGNEQVYTESTGEGQRRRVRIFPTTNDH